MGHSNSKLIDSFIDPLDFGPITPQGIHSTNSPPDYNTKLVKRFIKEGRLAPFYRGYFEKPVNNSVSQLSILASLDERSSSTSKNAGCQYSKFALTAKRMSLFLAKHTPENIQNYVLYKDSVECPICFLFYPPFINRTRCCDKFICTECFLQLKRSVDAPSLTIPCPFCLQPNLGIIRIPPPWSLHYASFCQRRSDILQNQQLGKIKRLCIFDRDVVLADHVRPDWQESLKPTSPPNISSNGTTRRTVVRPHHSN
ncbi:hypothetical protein BJ944DRAFT_260149 [Cunninghamella echinulata]|nr:hypothetical protein BJ944DRAFT_260149 [Cunninghamella echinulata]